jgi:ribonuclease G
VIARQIRLRDLGGIIVVDFIDLRGEAGKKKVYEELKKGFEEDRAVTKVLPMSDFGLVEITRQRLRPSITTTFSSANGASSEDEVEAADPKKLRKAERKIQRLEKKVEQREREVKRLKEENGTPDEDVAALRQKVQSLRDELEAARAQQETTDEQADARPESEESSADLPEGTVPKVLMKEIEQWIAEHSDQHRAVTLRVHPFVAAFLRRPVPTHPTRWFMEHLVRVHLEADAEVPPHTFQVAQSPSGELLPESP